MSESSSTSSSSCSGGTTTASDCRAACSAFPTTVDNSVQSTTVCYTTTCVQTTGCSIEPTTSTSITTSTPQACALSTPYKRDLAATYRSLGLELPLWLAYPITPLHNSEPRTSDAVPTFTGISDPTSASTKTFSSSRPTSTSTSSILADSPETPSTVSTTSSSSSSTSPLPTFPSDPAPSCHDENGYNGHAPVDSAFVDKAAGLFCASISNSKMTSDSEKFSEDYRASNNVNYMFEVAWVPGCKYTSDSQNTATPIGGDLSCEDLMKETYYGCNNGGVGGSIEAGCLAYSFTGGLGDDMVPAPEVISGDSNDEEPEDPAGAAEEQPTDPVDDSTELAEGQQTCFDTSDFSHQDIKWSLVKGSSKNFCAEAAGSMPNRNMTVDTESFGFFADGGVHFHLEWREGCEASTDSISVERPMGDDGRSCSELLKKVWKDCNNNEGVGGSVDVGCLSYAVIGGRDLYESLYGKL